MTQIPSPAGRSGTPGLPSVSVVLVNFNGVEHLPPCLDSIQALDYPAELLDVVCVDNASTDGSRELLAEHYPWVRVLAQDSNRGFAEGVQIGVRSSGAECVAFVNTDMKVDPEWLRELVRIYDPSDGTVCVGGLIVDWDGALLDFAWPAVNYEGHGHQIGNGVPFEEFDLADGDEIALACGGAMLVERAVFLDTGGFDPAYFAYFEDVDFGWRLWLLGYRIRLAARARSFHRRHGTSSRFPEWQRAVLYERNALRTLVKNLDSENMPVFLASTLLLLSKRAQLFSGSVRADYEVAAPWDTDVEAVQRMGLARLHAIGDVVDDLDALIEERRRIQRRRVRTDDEVFARFGRPFRPSARDDDAYLEAAARVRRALGVDRHFRRGRASRITIVAPAPLDALAATAPRAVRRLQSVVDELARIVPVTVAIPGDESGGAADVAVHSSQVQMVGFEGFEGLRLLVEEADAVVVDVNTWLEHDFLRTTTATVVVDLPDPWDAIPDHGRDGRDVLRRYTALLDDADFFLCRSESQRDWWLGMLSARGRVEWVTYGYDDKFRLLVDTLPDGCHPAACPATGRGSDIVWVGDSASVDDPQTALEAFVRVRAVVPDAHLTFMFPRLCVDELRPELEIRARELDLGVSCIDFVPYAAGRPVSEILAGFDIALTSVIDGPLARLRAGDAVLDAAAAGLAVVCAGETEVAHDLARAGGAWVVPAGDPDAVARCLVSVLGDTAERHRAQTQALEWAKRHTWRDATTPLRRVAEAPWRWREIRDGRRLTADITEDLQLLLERRRVDIEKAGARARDLEEFLRSLRDSRSVRLASAVSGVTGSGPKLRTNIRRVLDADAGYGD